MIKWKFAVYLRLSSDDGDKLESNSISNQKEMINLYLKKEKELKIIDYYIDDGFSGTDFERPGFKRLLEDMKNGKINSVIVKDLSRLGRNYIEVGNYLEEIFPLYNIRFIAINDNIDSYKDPKSINNLVVPFKNLMNDEYARDISNKVRSVLDTKKVNGEFIGSFAPYGYIKDPRDKHKLIIDKIASKVVRKIFRMILNGHSRQEVIDELNNCGILPPRLYQIQDKNYKFDLTDEMRIWNRRKLDLILTNQTYTGVLVQNKKKVISHKIHKAIDINSDDWIIVNNHHEAIISEEEFEKVQNILYSRDIRIKNNNRYDIFSGHLKCKDCGNTLTIKKGKRSEYYYCTSYLRNKDCSKHSISKSKLELIVLNAINLQIELIINLDKEIEDIIEESNVNYDYEILCCRINEIRKGIEKYSKLKEILKDDLICNYITKSEYIEYEREYSEILNKYYKEEKSTQEKLENVKIKSHRYKEWTNEFKKNKNLNKLSKVVIDELIDNIYLYEDGNLQIVYNYKNEYFKAIDFLKKHNCAIIKNNAV